MKSLKFNFKGNEQCSRCCRLAANACFQQVYCNKLTLRRKRKYIIHKAPYFLTIFCIICFTYVMRNPGTVFLSFQWKVTSSGTLRHKAWSYITHWCMLTGTSGLGKVVCVCEEKYFTSFLVLHSPSF